MNFGLKQRLVGAVVLIALAVIFLPMLLPGNSDSTMPLFSSNVPQPPNTRFEPIEIPLQVPPPAPQAEVAVIDTPQAGDAASDEPPQEAPSVAPVSAVTPTPPSALPPKPSPSTTPPVALRAPGEAWAVQLGSFSSSVNALALQEKARKAGFTAYVEKLKVGAGTSYRVRIGPESSRARADALRERVQEKLKMQGMVVPHKP
ncbi:MAG TPA: SPOR domain-containing protein [Gammaproteobacteria bacterium]